MQHVQTSMHSLVANLSAPRLLYLAGTSQMTLPARSLPLGTFSTTARPRPPSSRGCTCPSQHVWLPALPSAASLAHVLQKAATQQRAPKGRGPVQRKQAHAQSQAQKLDAGMVGAS